MKKKSLDQNIGVEGYNKVIFSQAASMLTKCKKIPVAEITKSSEQYRSEAVRDKFMKLENKFQSIFKILGKFVQAEKPTFGNSIDFATEIFQQSKVLIQTQIRKNQEQRNTVRRLKVEDKEKVCRPQENYQNIGPYPNFSEHQHRNYLEDGTILPLELYNGKQIIQPNQNLKNQPEQAMYVDTVEKLDQCIEQLSKASEIAVDVQHSNKSYQGITCLIQISSRHKDYIIDVFPIWVHVPKLSTIIGNPSILKVMHGAEMDTKWLQRDFNLHIINLFDTHKASRVLGMAKFSYAFLLQHYCRVDTNKMYQRADWRQRPLIPEMILYARMDTHYLLTIFDYIRVDLQKQSATMNLNIHSVLRDIQKNSHEVSLIEAELFSYKNKELYQNLEFQFKGKNSQQFKIIDKIFWVLNSVAFQNDENFDDMISKKYLIEAISFIKDLIYNKRSKVSKKARVDRVLGALKNSDSQHIATVIQILKPQLEKTFSDKNDGNLQDGDLTDKIKRNKQFEPKILHIKRKKQQNQQNTKQQQPEFIRQKIYQLSIPQYQPQYLSTQAKNRKPNKNSIKFPPILQYLSIVNNIPQQSIQDSDYSNDMDEEEQLQQELDELEIQQAQNDKLKQEQGVIQFQRMNPNVMYVIEQDNKQKQQEIDEAMKKKEPRKKRKEYEYEKRLKNKEGNIFELLQQ